MKCPKYSPRSIPIKPKGRAIELDNLLACIAVCSRATLLHSFAWQINFINNTLSINGKAVILSSTIANGESKFTLETLKTTIISRRKEQIFAEVARCCSLHHPAMKIESRSKVSLFSIPKIWIIYLELKEIQVSVSHIEPFEFTRVHACSTWRLWVQRYDLKPMLNVLCLLVLVESSKA